MLCKARRAEPSRSEQSRSEQSRAEPAMTAYIFHDRPNVSRCQSSCINIIRRPIIQLHGRGLGVPSRAHRGYIRPNHRAHWIWILSGAVHSSDLSVMSAPREIPEDTLASSVSLSLSLSFSLSLRMWYRLDFGYSKEMFWLCQRDKR